MPKFDPKPVRDAYIEAYKVANPGHKEPEIKYEGGWFRVVTFGTDGLRHQNVARSKDLAAWTDVLLRRAAKTKEGPVGEESVDAPSGPGNR